jgi:hypothetical protein
MLVWGRETVTVGDKSDVPNLVNRIRAVVSKVQS